MTKQDGLVKSETSIPFMVRYLHATRLRQAGLTTNGKWKITRLRFVPSVCPEGMEALKYSKSADKRSWEHMKVFFKEIFGGK